MLPDENIRNVPSLNILVHDVIKLLYLNSEQTSKKYIFLYIYIFFAPTYFNIKKRMNFSTSVLQVNLMFLFCRCKQFRNSSMRCFKCKSKNVSTTYLLPMTDSNSEKKFCKSIVHSLHTLVCRPMLMIFHFFFRELLTRTMPDLLTYLVKNCINNTMGQ